MAVADEPKQRDGTLHSADGTPLFWRAWEVERPKATVAVIHGLGEHSGRYGGFARAMSARGFSTFAVDLRGMGRSGGRRGFVNSWAEWVKDAETFLGQIEAHPSAGEVVPVGHSFGGIVLLSGILAEDLQPRRFVLSNPAFKPAVSVPGWKTALGRLTSRLVPTLTMSNEVEPETLSRDPAQVRAYADDPLVHDRITSRLYTEWLGAAADADRRAAELHTPFFLSLGDADRLIDHRAALAFAERAVNAPREVHVWEGRYHEPFNDLGSEEVFDAIAAWLA